MINRDDKDVLIYFDEDTEAKCRNLAVEYAECGIDALCKIYSLKAYEKPTYERASVIWDKIEAALEDGREGLKIILKANSYKPYEFVFKREFFRVTETEDSVLETKTFEIKKGTVLIDTFTTNE